MKWLFFFRKVDDNNYVIDALSNLDDDYFLEDTESFYDGTAKLSQNIEYERNSRNRKNAILIHGLSCQACGFNFEKNYGVLGKNILKFII